MSLEQAGAIIRIIFYILDLDGKIKDYFAPSYISNRYNKLLNQPPHGKKMKDIIKKCKKHSGKNGIKTLEKELQLRQWLNKHTNIKPIYWFDKSNGNFKLKTKYIEGLSSLVCSSGALSTRHQHESGVRKNPQTSYATCRGPVWASGGEAPHLPTQQYCG